LACDVARFRSRTGIDVEKWIGLSVRGPRKATLVPLAIRIGKE
jgi:hypothetical protein